MWTAASVWWMAAQGGLAADSAVDPAAVLDQGTELPTVVVEAEAESDHYVQGPFLPDVQGSKVNVGKKTTMIDLDALPRIQASNYRQALIEAPGLLLSEESTPLISIGYRGLEPHRAQYTQVLADGIPIHADPFGYPEAYYVPPLDTVDRIEYIRGGGSLMYGPQPGGALNYVTHRPSFEHAFGGATTQTFGADQSWSSFTHVDGTVDRLGYYVYYNHREGEGFRAANSDLELDAGYAKLALDADAQRRWFLTLESYRESHGEPGGLGFGSGINDRSINGDRSAITRPNDRFALDRDAATLTLEQDLERGQFNARVWAADYTRYSRRQRGGGFGTLPSGATAASNDIENQQFRTLGFESRWRRDWGSGEQPHVFSAGIQYYHADSPRTDRRGASANATVGELRIAAQRETRYLPVFAENVFRFGPLSVTPGLRLEHYEQSVQTRFLSPAAPARERDSSRTVALPGLGSSWDFSAQTRAYFNLSKSYRPVVYTESVPNSTSTVVDQDLQEGQAWQTDLGLRSTAIRGLTVDASVFHMVFKDKIGGAGTAADPIRNIGRIEYTGLEAAARYRVFGTADVESSAAALDLFLNFTVLDAEITRDANPARIGNAPQYAPDLLLRGGMVYSAGPTRKAALLATWVDDSYADDANSASRFIPAYQVWDLSAEWQLGDSRYTVLGGINNVFDERYYARIRNDGIDPAPGRNSYLGMRVSF